MVETKAVEHGAREFLVQTHVMCAKAYNAIVVAVAQANGGVDLVGIAAEGHEVYVGLGRDIE